METVSSSLDYFEFSYQPVGISDPIMYFLHPTKACSLSLNSLYYFLLLVDIFSLLIKDPITIFIHYSFILSHSLHIFLQKTPKILSKL